MSESREIQSALAFLSAARRDESIRDGLRALVTPTHTDIVGIARAAGFVVDETSLQAGYAIDHAMRRARYARRVD